MGFVGFRISGGSGEFNPEFDYLLWTDGGLSAPKQPELRINKSVQNCNATAVPAVSRSNLNLIEKRIYKPPLQCRQRVGSEIALYCVTYCTVALLIHDKRTDWTTGLQFTTQTKLKITKINDKNFPEKKVLETAVNSKIYTWIICYLCKNSFKSYIFV